MKNTLPETEAGGPLAMMIEMWPIGNVKPYPLNARKRTPVAIEKIAASIKEFGWVQPVVVDGAGVIIIGHGRLEAALFMKLEEVPVLVASGLSPGKVRALRIANRVHEESTWDLGMLGEELLGMKLEGVDLTSTALNIDEIIGDVFGTLGAKKKKTGGNNAPLEFKIVVECTSAEHQGAMLSRFKEEGMNVHALTG